EKAAAKAATRVQRKAVQHGMDKAAAERLAATAAKQARKAAPKGRGVSVRFAGTEVPGVRRATGATTRVARKVARKVAPRASQTIPAVARTVVREFAPRVAPAGVKVEQHVIGRAQTRAARATKGQGAERAEKFERELKLRVPREDHQRVIDAIERGRISDLAGPEYRKALRETKGDRRKARELLKERDPKAAKLVELVDNMQRELKGAYRQGVRSGNMPRRATPGEFLKPADLGKLDK